MLVTGRITSGSFSLGTISVDSARIHAEGLTLAPTLVVPMNVELDPRPSRERIALSRLEVALWVSLSGRSLQLGPRAVEFGDGSNGGAWASSDTHKFEKRVDVRFSLSSEMLRILEDAVHSTTHQALDLTLKITPAIGRVVGTDDVYTASGPAGQQHLLGTAYQFHPIAWSTVDHLDIRIGLSQWAEMAKSLGLSEIRLVAVRLPTGVEGLDPKLTSLFDAAILKYEQRDHREAIGVCRDIRHLVEKQLAATGMNSVSAIVAHERGLQSSSPPIQFLDSAWKLLAEVTNAARHDQSIDTYNSADARIVLLYTGLLLEYLADSLHRHL